MNALPETIFEAHQQWLRTVIASRLSDAAQVDDLVQEVFLSVVKQQSKLAEIENIAPWLYRIAVRTVLQYHRRKGREQSRVSQFATQKSSDTESVPEPYEWLVSNESSQQLRDAFAHLTGKDREILLLRHVHDWTYQRISDSLGVSVSTVEYRLGRARENLRRLLMGNALPSSTIETSTTNA